MANTPKPPKVGNFLPGSKLSGGGEWASVPKTPDVDPVGVLDAGSSSYVRIDTVDIVGMRENSQVARRSRWSAGEASPEHVAISRSSLNALGGDARVELRGLLEQHVPTFHAFVNGDIAPNAISALLLDAERIIVSSSKFESIEHFFGRDAMEGDYISEGEYGTYAFPGDEHGAAIAATLGWNADVFVDLVRMARVANHEKWISSGRRGALWDNQHMERLYRMLRLLQEKVVIPDADAFVQIMFAKNETSECITMQDLVCIYGKAAAEDLDFFDVIEILLNATWGDEPILVSKKSSQGESLMGTAWYADEQDHMYVYSRGLADIAAANMHGPNRQVSAAAVNYSVLAEQHLHGVGPSEGGYDFYLRELYRKEARKDLMRHPELYYDDIDPASKRSKSGVMNNQRALERLCFIFKGKDFEKEAAKITDAAGFIDADRGLFRDMNLDVSWVENVEHYARGTLYALLAIARFNQAGEEAMESDPDFARVSFSLAGHMINVYEERSVVLQYLSGPIRDSVAHLIIQPFDMMMFGRLYKRIKRNRGKVTPQKQPPPRRR